MIKNKLTVTGANILYFTFAALTIPAQIVIGILAFFYGQGFIDRNFYPVTLLTQFGLIFLPVMIYTISKKLNIKEAFRLNKLELRPAALILLMSVPAIYAASMFNSIAIYFLQKIGSIPPNPIPTPGNIGELITGIIVVAVTPAICEESLNRGILLSAYEKRGSMRAVAITAVLFGLFHFDITNLLGPVFLGLLIGYYVIRTNSIFAGMLAHFLNNSIAEIIQYMYRAETQGDIVPEITANQLFSDVVMGLAGIAVIFILMKVFKRVTEKSCHIKPPISSLKNDVISVLSHWPIISVLAIYLISLGLFILTAVFSSAGYLN